MRTGIDSRIDAFQNLLEQAGSLHGQLQVLEAAIFEQDYTAKQLEQFTSQHERDWHNRYRPSAEHPLALQTRRVKKEVELRKVLPKAVAAKREALNAASELITNAAGGRAGLITFPFARWHYLELAHHQSGPSTRATPAARLAHLRGAWHEIDFAVAAIREIELDAQRGQLPYPQKQQFSSSSTTARNSSKNTASGCGG